MAIIIEGTSRTFSEYLMLPGHSTSKHLPQNTNLQVPVKKFKKGETSSLSLNIPLTSACMQAVSGPDLAIALARQGGMSFIFCSQPIDKQKSMIEKVKSHKAGFVVSDSNLKPTDTLADFVALQRKSGHSTMPVTEDGTGRGKFLGIITSKDFWEYEDNLTEQVQKYMTPFSRVIYGKLGISLKEANTLLHREKKQCLPILDENQNLQFLVFTKDFVDHRNNPLELLDSKKQLVVAGAINTHDYMERVPALLEAGADALCFDSSDGYSDFQAEAAMWIRKTYGPQVIVGGGNVVSADGFRFLVEKGDVDFVKVGIGGGSICITREQKGIGRGQASAVLDVVNERNKYFMETGIYIPICSDGGLVNDTQIFIALAMGADFMMMGRYFAMTYESPPKKISIKDKMYKPYWGEGSNRAKNWKRYHESGSTDTIHFEEGVDAYVPLAGSVSEVVPLTIAKLRATMCNLGTLTVKEFQENTRLTLVSEQSFIEGGTTNVTTLSDLGINRD
jgi:IMP dehydrogenase